MASYRPIDCDFHDLLEIACLKKQSCRIVIREASGEESTRDIVIKDLLAQDHEEFVILGNGDRIRLDHIISVNGKTRNE